MLSQDLSNLKQLTFIDGCVSVLDIIEWGVPQGPVLGPLLFLIFVNEIPNASELLTWLFADDTALAEVRPCTVEFDTTVTTALQKCLLLLLGFQTSVT